MAGGSGPFFLYEEFWACHCSDTTENIDEVASALKPELTATSLTTGTAPSVSSNATDMDMCRAMDPGKPDVCPRKLPLRFIRLMMENSGATTPVISFVMPSVQIPYTNLLEENHLTDYGFSIDGILRPPRNT